MTIRRALLVALLVGLGLSSVATTQDPITPTLLQDLNQSGAGTPQPSFPVGVTRTAATLWVSADVPGLGRELWKTDGTHPGTTFVDDLGTGTARSFHSALALPDGTLVVAATTAALGAEPSRSSRARPA